MQQSAEGDRVRPRSLIHRTDLGVSVLILLCCAFLFWDTTRFDVVPSSLAQNVQPTTFPRLLIGTIVVLTLMLPFEYLQKKRQGIDLDSGRREWPRPIVFVTAAVLIGLVLLMPPLGTVVTLVIACAGLPLLWGERRYGIIAVYAIAFPLAITALFVGVLEVNFLPGIAGHLFR